MPETITPITPKIREPPHSYHNNSSDVQKDNTAMAVLPIDGGPTVGTMSAASKNITTIGLNIANLIFSLWSLDKPYTRKIGESIIASKIQRRIAIWSGDGDPYSIIYAKIGFILPNALDQTFRAVAHKAAPPRL